MFLLCRAAQTVLSLEEPMDELTDVALSIVLIALCIFVFVSTMAMLSVQLKKALQDRRRAKREKARGVVEDIVEDELYQATNPLHNSVLNREKV